MNLQNKTVLITGAAKRLGKEMARAFANQKARVLIHYHHSETEAKALAEELKTDGVKTEVYQADLLNHTELERMSEEILKKENGIDILINSASLFFPTPFESITEKHWDDFYSIHVKAPFFLAQAFAPEMKRRGEGRIINIADWNGLRPYKEYLPYSVSKGALITMTQGLAKILAPEILVNAICPGPVLPGEKATEAHKKEVAEKTLLKRWGSPDDIAKTALFLAQTDYITGHYHLVDGGEFLKG